MKSKLKSRTAAVSAAALSVVVASLLVVPASLLHKCGMSQGSAPMAPSRPSC